MVRMDPIMRITQPRVGFMKFEMCQPNIRQFIIIGTLLVGVPLEYLNKRSTRLRRPSNLSKANETARIDAEDVKNPKRAMNLR